jgi:hypothetical protein
VCELIWRKSLRDIFSGRNKGEIFAEQEKFLRENKIDREIFLEALKFISKRLHLSQADQSLIKPQDQIPSDLNWLKWLSLENEIDWIIDDIYKEIQGTELEKYFSSLKFNTLGDIILIYEKLNDKQRNSLLCNDEDFNPNKPKNYTPVNYRRIQPLFWPDNWKNGLPKSRWSRFWLGQIPFLGPENIAERFINKQLKQRNYKVCLSQWGTDEERIKNFLDFSEIIKRWFKWQNQNFIPADPFQIIFFDATGFHVDDARDDAFSEMRTRWNVSQTDLNEWNELTLGEVIDRIVMSSSKRK